MAEKKVQVETVEKNEVLERAKGFWAKFSKPIIIAGSVIILGLVGFYGYKHFYKIPNDLKAKELIIAGEKIFDDMSVQNGFTKDSVNLALNGDKTTGTIGLLTLISKYGGTPDANRAQYMIGACYLHLKEFDKAIKYLKEFDGNGADQVQSKAYIMLGHAYAEKKNAEEAISYYKKGVSVASEYPDMAAEALFIAGVYSKSLGKAKEATELFKEIKDKYPASSRAMSGDADKYLASLGVLSTTK